MDENNDLERAIFQDGLAYQVDNTYEHIYLEPNNVMTSPVEEWNDDFWGVERKCAPIVICSSPPNHYNLFVLLHISLVMEGDDVIRG